MTAMGTNFKIPPFISKKYDLGGEIARGKYGIVYECLCLTKTQPCALKFMLKKGNKKQDVLREVDILKKLNGHPGVLTFTDFFEGDKEFVLVTELLNGGELFDYVIAKEYLDEKEASYYMKQILSALDFCHKQRIVHLDLKPENIVLKEKNGKYLKIIDFGTAQDLSVNLTPNVMVGTAEFIAPEVLNFEPVTCASDMWAIGVITYVLLTGMSPFLGDDDMETIKNISLGEFEYPNPEPNEEYKDISVDAKAFIDSLLVSRPSQRSTADSSLQHKWLITKRAQITRIDTKRLEHFRARRRMLATIQAVRVSLAMMKGAIQKTST